MNEEPLDRYARLLVEHTLSLRDGQRLDVWGELGHREFAYRVGDAAYRAGAGQVRYRLADPLESEQLIRCARPDQITLHYQETRSWLANLIGSRGALLALAGKTDPGALVELQRAHPANHQALTLESGLLNRELHRTLDQRLLPMTIAVCPTAGWAHLLFPELPKPEALDRFWELVFTFTGANREDATEHAHQLSHQLAERAAALDALEIRELHVRGGGNDLRVRLSGKARWQSDTLTTLWGQRFCTNVPSFEVFITPDRRHTAGYLVATKPVRLNGGVVVEGLKLTFESGKVVDFTATSGAEAFGRSLETDDGARYLGEFALVGQDSPLARCGMTFGHLLLDENAGAHIALGHGFPRAFEPGTSTPGQLETEGCNRSTTHIDIPFGSAAVDVLATQSRAGEVVLLEQGLWAGRLGDALDGR